MFCVDIVIIDSGINFEKAYEKNCVLKGIKICKENNKYCVQDDIFDAYGHGTAVYNIIKKNSSAERIFMIKIFDGEEDVDEELLVYALKYINENIKCKVINLSLGIRICADINDLRNVCNELYKKGTIIVAAFDNEGCYSYPAAFDNVIGVSSNYQISDAQSFEIVEGSPVNVLAKGGYQRVKWLDSKEVVLGGNSFACAYTTAYIFNIVAERIMSFGEVLYEMRKNAIKIYEKAEYTRNSDNFFEIKKAAVFPVNKEMHSLIRFSKSLDFLITGVYDIKQSGRVGANCKKIIKALDNEILYVIKDVDELNFEAVDTIIIGHMDEINRIIKKDMRLELIMKAVEKNVNVFSFDNLAYCQKEIENRNNLIYYPKISQFDILQNRFGKLYNISKPVVGVFGTSSKQGKFTLQITLKKLFEDMGYSVGAIGTEPHALLFGMDYVYPLGYNSAIYVDDYSSIAILNKMVNDLCHDNADIIISGSQGGCIATNYNNLSSVPVRQHTFLLGLQPDAMVLCVNPTDNMIYILNTIKYLEGVTNGKVVAIVIFPQASIGDWRVMFDIKETLKEEVLQETMEEICEITNLPVYVLGKTENMIKLRDTIIDYFCDGDEE